MLLCRNEQSIVTCGRCEAILTRDELDNQRYDDRPRCYGCDNPTRPLPFPFDDVRTSTDRDAQREWLRRLAISQLDAWQGTVAHARTVGR